MQAVVAIKARTRGDIADLTTSRGRVTASLLDAATVFDALRIGSTTRREAEHGEREPSGKPPTSTMDGANGCGGAGALHDARP